MSTTTSHSIALVGGRVLAACLHPLAAWRYPDGSFRLPLVIGYVAAGYIVGLAAAILMN